MADIKFYEKSVLDEKLKDCKLTDYIILFDGELYYLHDYRDIISIPDNIIIFYFKDTVLWYMEIYIERKKIAYERF